MQYVYILQSKHDSQLYVGCTNDLKKRVRLHNGGKVVSTKKRRPFKLLYYEAHLNKDDAFAREGFFKTGWGRRYIQKLLSHYLHSQKI